MPCPSSQNPHPVNAYAYKAGQLGVMGMGLLSVSSGTRIGAVIAAALLLATGLSADGANLPASEVAIFALSNDGSTLAERTISFGQAFRPGTVGKQDQLQAA